MIDVTLWGKCASLLDLSLIEANEHPVVIAITNCEIFYEDDKQVIRSICGTAAIRFTINPNIDILGVLRKRLNLLYERNFQFPKEH